MNILLDTHVVIWALTAPRVLPDRIRQLIADPENQIYVSAVSVWEIAIKFSLKKRSAPPFSGTEALRHFENAGYEVLSVVASHAAAVDNLPRIHGDPFDRLLVAQALSEPMRLISRDPRVAAYSDIVISW